MERLLEIYIKWQENEPKPGSRGLTGRIIKNLRNRVKELERLLEMGAKPLTSAREHELTEHVKELEGELDKVINQRNNAHSESIRVQERVKELESHTAELANYIMAEVPGEPSRSEGAIECAIRVIPKRGGY
jgi:uncharacterized coiled-coil DUF342 family protein